MKIIKATIKDMEQVLALLDEFREACMDIIDPSVKHESKTAKEFGPRVYKEVMAQDTGTVFLAEDKGKYVGILTAYMIPQIRRGVYCIEAEEMYVKNEYRRTGVAALLIDALCRWAKRKHVTTVRLESHNALIGAHSFYEKQGFVHYGHAYEKRLS